MDKLKQVKSSSSCNVNEIKSFQYGPISARFYMFRKQINSMFKKYQDIPFYAWQCLTIQNQNRSTDFVIEDE